MKKYNLSFISIAIYYSIIYMSGGAFSSYIGLYYSSIGLGNSQIGLLTSIGAIIAILAQPVWGIISDRSTLKNRVLTLCLLFSGLTIWLMFLPGNIFWLLAIFTAVFYLFHCAINPLSDAITLELSRKENFRFSAVRTVGSLGFAIMAAIAGMIFDKDINRIFVVFSVLMLAAFLLSFLIPPVEGHQSRQQKIKLWALFNNKELVLLYAYTFIIESTLGFFYSFHSVYSESVGISTYLIGIGVMVGSFSQFPFMIFFDRIYKKFGIKNILFASGIVHAVRWLLYAFALTPRSIVFIWALHGFTYIVFYLCLAEYVNSNVIDELKSSGQAMNSIMIQGISRFFGGFLGGILASAISLKYVFLIGSVICIAATACFFVVMKKYYNKNAKCADATDFLNGCR